MNNHNTRPLAARAALLWNIVLRRQRHGAMVGRVLALALFALLPLASSVAADDSPFLTAPGGPWQYNETTQDFSIYAAQHDPVATQLNIYKQIADSAYEMESGIFGASLPLKVPIYLYTDDPQFIAAVPAAQADKNLYSGVDNGGVYIATQRMNGLKAPELTLNLRMLLTQQIAATMSGGNLPAGISRGIALYSEASPAELPALIATLNQQAGANRLSDWTTLANTADSSLAGQQYSVVAFLLDTYGLRQYRAFLTALSKPEAHNDWRQAMQMAYTTEGPAAAATLEAKWKAYLPQFIGGLWQQNQFAYYNIDAATQLVGTGQYTQAVTVLTPAIAFLQQTGTPKRASDAQALLSKARAGSEAESRVRDAQVALEGNDYTGTKTLLDQAREIYKGIPDAKPPLILAQYQQRADRGLQATDNLTHAEADINGWNVIRARQNANRAFATFTEFGNAPLADRAASVTQRANDRIRIAGISVIGTGVLILLGGFVIIGLQRGRRAPLALPPLD